jgi:hypothetical protein
LAVITNLVWWATIGAFNWLVLPIKTHALISADKGNKTLNLSQFLYLRVA